MLELKGSEKTCGACGKTGAFAPPAWRWPLVDGEYYDTRTLNPVCSEACEERLLMKGDQAA